MKHIPMKRITVLITNKNNEKIQRFRTAYINETKENMSYAEALNWVLHFGASSWFHVREDLRKRFYKVWAKSNRHRKYEREIDEFDFLEFIQKREHRKQRETKRKMICEYAQKSKINVFEGSWYGSEGTTH